MPAIILFAVWKNFGYNMIIFLAGLQSIPGGSLRGGAHRRRVGRRSSSATSRCRCSRRCCCSSAILTDGRLLPALRRAVRDDAGRPAAEHASACSTSCTRKASAGGTSGFASAVAFVLFVFDVRRHGCCSCGSRARSAVRMKRAPGAVHRQRRARSASAAVHAAFRCCGWSSASFMPPGEASTFPPPLLPARSDARQLPRAVRARRPRPLPRQQRAARDRRDARCRSLFNAIGRLRVRQAALRRARPPVPRLARRARDSRAGRDAAAVPAAEAAGAGQHLRRRDRARRWPASSASSWCASTRCRSPTSCSRRRASTARASSRIFRSIVRAAAASRSW